MGDTDSIAQLRRAVAVTLIAATQRPTQRAMGQGAVRSQMDLRICFRVRERKSRPGPRPRHAPRAGWDAHNLNAPGKFLVSAPEHQTPKRARAYLLTDQAVTNTAARYTGYRPALDEQSQRAIRAASEPSRPSGEAIPATIRTATRPRSRIPGARSRRDLVARAVHGPRRRRRHWPANAPDRDEPTDPLPPPAPNTPGQAAPSGQPWSLAREHHGGAHGE